MDPITGTLATVASLGNISGSIYAANKQTKAPKEQHARRGRSRPTKRTSGLHIFRPVNSRSLNLQALMADPASIE